MIQNDNQCSRTEEPRGGKAPEDPTGRNPGLVWSTKGGKRGSDWMVVGGLLDAWTANLIRSGKGVKRLLATVGCHFFPKKVVRRCILRLSSDASAFKALEWDERTETGSIWHIPRKKKRATVYVDA